MRRRPPRAPTRYAPSSARIVPPGDRVEHERHRPLGKRRRAVGHAADRATPLVDVGFRTADQHSLMDLAQSIDQLVVEPREYVALKYA